MVFRIVEGKLGFQGTVSGTDQTLAALTNVQEHPNPNVLRIWLENPSGGVVTGVASLNTATGTITLNGVDGNTVITAVPVGPITVSGFRTEFVTASGYLQAGIDSVDLQQAYDNGTGRIDQIASAKPVVLSGTDPDDTVLQTVGAVEIADDPIELGTGTKTVNGFPRGHRLFVHESEGYLDYAIGVDSHGTIGPNPGLRTYSSRGDHPGGLEATTSGDIVGVFQGHGHDGADYERVGSVLIIADEDGSPTSIKGKVDFRVQENVGALSTRGGPDVEGWQFENFPLRNIGNVIAASGTYSDSLTISGSPVHVASPTVAEKNFSSSTTYFPFTHNLNSDQIVVSFYKPDIPTGYERQVFFDELYIIDDNTVSGTTVLPTTGRMVVVAGI